MSRLRSLPPRTAKAPPRIASLPAKDRQQTRALNTNSVAWKRLREQVLVRDNHQCRVCGKLVVGKQAQVDHIHNDAADPSSNKLERLWLLCLWCHGEKTMCEKAGKRWSGLDGKA